jgi:hypothetical protein
MLPTLTSSNPAARIIFRGKKLYQRCSFLLRKAGLHARNEHNPIAPIAARYRKPVHFMNSREPSNGSFCGSREKCHRPRCENILFLN